MGLGFVTDQRPPAQLANVRHVSSRGSVPYSQVAPSRRQTAPAVGSRAGQRAVVPPSLPPVPTVPPEPSPPAPPPSPPAAPPPVACPPLPRPPPPSAVSGGVTLPQLTMTSAAARAPGPANLR